MKNQLYEPDFLSRAEQGRYYDILLEELQWQQQPIRIFGKEYWQPRLLAWYGDAEAVYSYSGIRQEPLCWTGVLLELKKRVEDFTAAHFNSVLANYYRDGCDSMGWHSDDESELGENPLIASLSLGATRRFCMRPRKGVVGEKMELLLEGGSLLLMQGDFQKCWQHSIPKTAKPTGGRINLTFRWIAPKTQHPKANSL